MAAPSLADSAALQAPLPSIQLDRVVDSQSYSRPADARPIDLTRWGDVPGGVNRAPGTIERLAYRVAEVCVMLDLSKSTAWRMIDAGKMPVLRYGRTVRVPKWWIDDQTRRAA